MSVVCLGELLIDFVALESGVEVGEASGFQKAPGGAPANVAVAVSRLGYASAFLGQVGNDPFGHYLAGVLEADGVNIEGLRFSDAARTALAFVSLGADGERSFMFYRHPSADMLMQPEDVALQVIEANKIFHFGSITMIGEPSRSATLSAVRRAQELGLIISYDPNLRLPLWASEEEAKSGMMLGLEYANILKISDEELDFLTEDGNARDLWRDVTELILVTHGVRGATAYTADDEQYYAGYPVQSADTTGAGDSFVAGILTGILKYQAQDADYQDYLAEIVPFANAIGAITTTKRGAIPSLPTTEQVMDFLASIN